MATKALEGKDVTLSTTFTKYLEKNLHRRKLRISNKDATNAIFHKLLVHSNPWSVSLDGTGDRITADTAIPEILSSPGATFVFKFKIDATGSAETLVAMTDASSVAEIFAIGTNASDQITLQLTTGGTNQWVGHGIETTMIADQWYTVEVYHNGTRPVMKIDGAVETLNFSTSTDLSQWVTSLSFSATDAFTFGASEVNSTQAAEFTGDIDFVYVYADLNHQTPIALYNLDEGTGTAPADSSGHGYTATITNATWAARGVGAYLGASATEIKNLDDYDGAEITGELWMVADAGTPAVNIMEWEN